MPHALARRSRFSDSTMTARHMAAMRTKRRSIGDMNVTPFIDVLLVLLVMIILAVPIKVHETSVDLPTESCEACVLSPVTNLIAITDRDAVLWNGVAVNSDQLRDLVAEASAMDQVPELRFAPDANAGYDISARTIALIKESGAKSFAFVGNEQYRQFGR